MKNVDLISMLFDVPLLAYCKLAAFAYISITVYGVCNQGTPVCSGTAPPSLLRGQHTASFDIAVRELSHPYHYSFIH